MYNLYVEGPGSGSRGLCRGDYIHQTLGHKPFCNRIYDFWPDFWTVTSVLTDFWSQTLSLVHRVVYFSLLSSLFRINYGFFRVQRFELIISFYNQLPSTLIPRGDVPFSSFSSPVWPFVYPITLYFLFVFQSVKFSNNF